MLIGESKQLVGRYFDESVSTRAIRVPRPCLMSTRTTMTAWSSPPSSSSSPRGGGVVVFQGRPSGRLCRLTDRFAGFRRKSLPPPEGLHA